MSIKSPIIKYSLVGLAIIYGFSFIMWSTNSGYYGEDHSEELSAPQSNVSTAELRTHLKGGYYACITKEKFDEMMTATSDHDNLQIGTLLSNGCVLTNPGVRFSYIKGAGFGVAKIRAYSGSGSIILYTNHENVYY